MKTVLVTFGTRPEAIKMAPVVDALRARPDDLRCVVCVTGQHRGMLDQVLDLFDLVPDIDLDLMQPGQTLNGLTARVLDRMADVLRDTAADEVIVQGDTTTAMATALAAFHLGIPVAHVEAGLRSGRLDAPFPEEMNRVVIDRLAAHLYPPTPGAARHLEAEGVPAARCLVTGNTAIDALLGLRARLDTLDLPVRKRFEGAGRLVLVTCHRRESFGAPIREVFAGLQALAEAHPDITFVYPVHLNPQVQEPARALLTAPNLALIEPVHYGELVWLLDKCELAISDSGGIQEEAPTLGRPLLVLREVTERPEVVDAGAGILVGTDRARIEAEATRLLADAAAREAMGRARFLFGDGHAAERIAAHRAGEPVAAGGPPPCRVVLVDDGSTDGSADAARSVSGLDLEVIVHDPNQGLGAAMRTGIQHVLAEGQDDDLLVALDADNTHPTHLMPGMVARANAGADRVIASRFQPGAEIHGLDWLRKFVSQAASWLLRVLFPCARDYTCGYRCYRVGLLRWGQAHYGAQFLNQRGFSVMVDLLLKLRRKAQRIEEVPLLLRYDLKQGVSKMKVVQTAVTTLRLLARRFVGNPRGP